MRALPPTGFPHPRERPWLTVAELSAITGEGQKAIRAALDAGQLPMLRVGRYVRIPTAALLRQLGIDQQPSAETEVTLRAVPDHGSGPAA
jgi:excisionase family DNA binding protein